jgi:alkanesulfonate monooxygenase SsuD/methylene tetrahydromethanopterin reductase-like flavin-dependent oxidoreductase (luciferase family)
VTAIQLTPPAQRLAKLPAISHHIERLRYTAIWIGEVNIVDSVVPASIVACSTDSIMIGTLFNVYTRAPTNVVLSGAGLAHAAPGRVALVLGASSPLLVERWNGIPYVRPYDRVSDYLKFLRSAFSGERVKAEFRTFTSSGFSLDDPPSTPPMVFVAAAMPRMMALASDQADGVVLNWMAPHDLDHFDSLRCQRDRVWLSMIVSPTKDRTVLDSSVRPLIAKYLAIPAYANLQRRAGRGPALESMWKRWAASDGAGARSQLPNSVIDELVVSGEPEECGRWIRSAERHHGIHIVATILMPEGMDYHDVLARISAEPNKR